VRAIYYLLRRDTIPTGPLDEYDVTLIGPMMLILKNECPKAQLTGDTFNKLPMAILYNPFDSPVQTFGGSGYQTERQFLIFNH